MDPSHRHEPVLAPSSSGHAHHARAPGAGSRPMPRLDEHLVRPEVTRDEIVRGERVVAMPSLPEHGDTHFGLDYVLGAHVARGYVGSNDLLTRFSHESDFATDTCIRRKGKDPATGDRYLEEVAFEIVNTQSAASIRARAEDVTARGVRRFFAIFVKKGEVAEWSVEEHRFVPVDPSAEIRDPTLAVPLTVQALLDAAEADNGVARALLAKKNPVLLADRQKQIEKGVEKGILQGKIAALLAVLEARALPVSDEVRRTITACTSARTLDRWLKQAVTAASAAEAIASPGNRRT